MKNAAKLKGQLRHWLTIAGAALVAGGYAEQGVWDQIMGGVLAALGLYLSWVSPDKKVGEGDPK